MVELFLVVTMTETSGFFMLFLLLDPCFPSSPFAEATDDKSLKLRRTSREDDDELIFMNKSSHLEWEIACSLRICKKFSTLGSGNVSAWLVIFSV